MITVRIEGPQGSGKTRMAEGLQQLLLAAGKNVLLLDYEELATHYHIDPRTEVLIVTVQKP